MPKILMHGRWKGGSSGNCGQSNSTHGISGVSQIITGSHVGHGKITGTIVVDESLPVVVSQMLVVIEKSVKSARDTPGGSVVMVDVTVPLGGDVMPDVGTGPTVSVEPSVVIVSTPVMTGEPGGMVKIIVEPSGSVSVSTVPVWIGVRVIVTPSVVIV